MEEVPVEIWDKTYGKWTQALIDGWDSDVLWNGCSLCSWCNGQGDTGCQRCPLRKGNWCVNTGDYSRLHEYYYRHVDKMWEDGVKEFLAYLEPYCTMKLINASGPGGSRQTWNSYKKSLTEYLRIHTGRLCALISKKS